MSHMLIKAIGLGLLVHGQLTHASPAVHQIRLAGNSSATSEYQASTSSPSWTFSSFTYQTMSTNRYATPLPSPLSQPAYGPPLSEATTLLPTSVTYTTYSLQATETLTDDGPYGQSAYAALWAGISYSSSPPFTTTVSPTPIASSELVFPPKLPARAMHDADGLKFPADFVWGGAASAWQIEGGLQLEGRGPATVDTTGMIGDESGAADANVANMNYFLYKQDIARLAALGIPYYSFSIAWARVVPFGRAGSPVNQEALDHYDDVINTCIAHGVTPAATLLHLDAPAGVLEDLGTFPDHFLYYAQQVLARYGDRVPIWFTLNEPNLAVPWLTGDYNVFTALLTAHARAYRWYKEDLGGRGRMTFKFANNLAMPLDVGSATDTAAARRYQDFILGIMANPTFLGQQYPATVLATPGINLTALTADQIALIRGTADFWAFDPYTAQYATDPPGGYAACARNASDALWPACAALGSEQANGWLLGAPSGSFVYMAPEAVRSQLGFVWNTYRPRGGVMVTEFGFPVFAEAEKKDPAAQAYDLERSLYYANFLTEMLHAMYDDGVRVIGALAWSFVDNNEWGSYGDQFGMQIVNRTDGSFDQRFKRSLFDYVDWFHDHVEQQQEEKEGEKEAWDEI
ncbi:beta-glucosidase [Xylariomycetidae sp. FL2044]|nr:beta-glucosidase [Xylariomycetidae sp. FL2044]